MKTLKFKKEEEVQVQGTNFFITGTVEKETRHNVTIKPKNGKSQTFQKGIVEKLKH